MTSIVQRIVIAWLKIGMFPVNLKKSVNRFSINRTETGKMEAKLTLCKSRFISIVDVTILTLDAASFSSMYYLNDVKPMAVADPASGRTPPPPIDQSLGLVMAARGSLGQIFI